jgi:hypothetical protein
MRADEKKYRGRKRLLAVAAMALALGAGAAGFGYAGYGERLARGLSMLSMKGASSGMPQRGESAGLRPAAGQGRAAGGSEGGASGGAWLRVAAYGGILVGSAALTALAASGLGALSAGAGSARRRRGAGRA